MNLELVIPIASGIVFGIIWCWAMYRGAESPRATQLPLKPACMICTKSDGEVQSVYSTVNPYHARTHNFHIGCVVHAVCNPKEYDGYRVDYALEIVRAMRARREAEENMKVKQFQEALRRKSECKAACKQIRDEDLFPS
jgi:hypothetical protein